MKECITVESTFSLNNFTNLLFTLSVPREQISIKEQAVQCSLHFFTCSIMAINTNNTSLYFSRLAVQENYTLKSTEWANENRTFLNVDNFAMVSGRKACDMSKVC